MRRDEKDEGIVVKGCTVNEGTEHDRKGKGGGLRFEILLSLETK